MHYNYRLATTDDAQQLMLLFQQVYIHTYGLEGVSKEFSNFIVKQFASEKIINDIESDQSDIWVATYKDNPIGALMVGYNKASPIGGIVAPEIDKLYVLSHFYGKGVGQKLMELVEEDLRAKEHTQVWLWAYAYNDRALRFYEKLAYKSIGIAYFQMENNSYKNEVLLKKLEIA